MRTLRLVHTYLGCAFAPLLIFFILTGFLQTFDLHEGRKDGSYQPPAWVEAAATVHQHQHLPAERSAGRPPRVPMRVVFGVMCAGLLCTVTLGLVMAWKIRPERRGMLIAVIAGAVIPVAVVFLQRK